RMHPGPFGHTPRAGQPRPPHSPQKAPPRLSQDVPMATRLNLADLIRPVRRLAGRVESAEVRWFGHSILSILFRQRVLVLETMGRKTGARRRTVVAYREAGGQVVVVGGAGGQS